MEALKWHQVHEWRLLQHGLLPRSQHQDCVKAAARTGGIQAQVMSAAELALCTRVEGLSVQDVRSALWRDRTLVKTWAMRGTLHVLAASELPRYVAARSFHSEVRNWPAYFAYHDVTPAQQEALLSAIPHVLGDEPMTRERLAIAIGKQTGVAQLRELILTANWGSPLKPSAFRGDLCFGPSQGQHVTFVNPRVWFGNWSASEPEQALQEIARLYLASYGPATPENFAHWWGGGKAMARKLFRSMGEELVEVDVEGWQAVALRATLETMSGLKGTETVCLLPLFDAYTLGLGRGIEPLLSSAHKSHVFRPQGWISAVVLVNGSIQGVWQHDVRRSQTIVKVRLFSSPTASVQKGIAIEAERLGDLFKTKVLLECEYPQQALVDA